MRNERKEYYLSANQIMLAWPRQRQLYFRYYNHFSFHFQEIEVGCDYLESGTWVDWRNTLSR